MKLIGLRKIDFVPQGQDRKVQFGQLYLGEPITQNGIGLRVEVAKCTLDFYDSIKDVKINSEVNVFYDKYQRVVKLEVV